MSDVYEALGGVRAVRAAVDVFYRRVVADPALARHFEGIDLSRLAAHQRAFLTAALGGPDLYSGRDLAEAHAGLTIADADFDAVTDHLLATLRDLGAPAEALTATADTLESYRTAIVDH